MRETKKNRCRPLACSLLALLLPILPLSTLAADQEPTVTITAHDVTVKELLRMIEETSEYSFAYVDTEIPARKVSVKAKNRTIQSIIGEALPEMEMKALGLKIILTPRNVQQKDGAPPTAPEDVAAKVLKGRVLDDKLLPVAGAVIVVKGATTGTLSNDKGEFSLGMENRDAVIEVSMAGYVSSELSVSAARNFVEIILTSHAVQLSDVVVIGYGVQAKRDVTTSISSMSADDFTNMPTTDFRDAMAAKMPGVQVVQLGGQPYGNVSIRVRGIQSATAGNDPLYVIDGIPCDARAFFNLDSSDIESLEVLKDASAAAIYGSRGSCGVILITTKRGKSERPMISYDGQFSVSTVSKKLELLNAYEFAQLYKEARDGAYLGAFPEGSIDDPYDPRSEPHYRVNPLGLAYINDRTGTLTDTDWQDAIFRTAYTTKHALSVSGRGKAMNYYVGANYLFREGTIIGSDFERYGIRVNLDGQRNRLKYGVNFSPTYSVANFINADVQYTGDGVIASALMANPMFPVYNDDGSYNWDLNGYMRTNTWPTAVTDVLNPVALATEIDDIRERVTILGSAYVSYEFIKGLELKVTAGADSYYYVRNYYRPSYIPKQGYQYYGNPVDPTAQNNVFSSLHWNVSNQLTFNRRFGDHSVNAIAVYEAEKEMIKTSQIVGIGVAGDDKIRTTRGKTIDPANTYDNKYGYTFASWLVRGQYSYKGRYLLSASLRHDGSSRFAPNSRWGYFPAVSVGWHISDEAFMERVGVIDDLKLRMSVGQTGNAQIGNSAYLALYNPSYVDLGTGLVSQIYPNQIANNDLHWEKNNQYGVGIDLSLWRGTIELNADYYYTRTTDMLLTVPISSVSGQTTTLMNIGSMQNQGVELNLAARKRFGNVILTAAANWTLNRNKVLSLGDEDAPIIKSGSVERAYYITQVGKPIGNYYLLVADGIFHSQEEIDSYPHFDSALAGDLRFVDVDGDGVMDQEKDRMIVGNYMPDFFYGFSVGLNYKNFSFDANFQGVYGNEILNLERRYLMNMEVSTNMMKETLNRFPYGEGMRATRKSTGNSTASISTYHLEDGSYLRLQNVSLGYTFPDRWMGRSGISKLKVYLQGSNVFTWTKYSGYNPEVNKNSSDALRPGEDYCSYPLARTFSVGINFNL